MILQIKTPLIGNYPIILFTRDKVMLTGLASLCGFVGTTYLCGPIGINPFIYNPAYFQQQIYQPTFPCYNYVKKPLNLTTEER